MMKNLVLLFFIINYSVSLSGQTAVALSYSTLKNSKFNIVDDVLKTPDKNNSSSRVIPLDKESILIYDYDGALMSYNIETEVFNWTVKTSDPAVDMCANQLLLADGIIYIPFINGEIYALNNKTGATIWKTKIENATDKFVFKSQLPVIHNDKLFIATLSPNNCIYALNSQSGKVSWKYELEKHSFESPILHYNNRIYTQDKSSVYSLDANTGKLIQHTKLELPTIGKIVTDEEYLFIPTDKNVILCFNAKTLQMTRQIELEVGQQNVKDCILVKENRLYFASTDAEKSSLYAVDSKKGTLIWQTNFTNEKIQYIVEESDNIWGYTQKGKLFQIDISNGEIAFEIKLLTKPISNLEFAENDFMYYFSEAALIQFEFNTKDENELYLRTSIKEDPDSAYLKLIR